MVMLNCLSCLCDSESLPLSYSVYHPISILASSEACSVVFISWATFVFFYFRNLSFITSFLNFSHSVEYRSSLSCIIFLFFSLFLKKRPCGTFLLSVLSEFIFSELLEGKRVRGKFPNVTELPLLLFLNSSLLPEISEPCAPRILGGLMSASQSLETVHGMLRSKMDSADIRTFINHKTKHRQII